MYAKAVISLFFALVVVVMTACGSKEITITGENGEKTTVKSDNNTTTISSKDGEAKIQSNSDGSKTTFESKDKDGNVSKMEISDGTKIPDGFPSDIPIIAKAKLTSSIKTNSEGKTAYIIGFEVKDSLEAVQKTYKDYMAAKGYKDVNEMTADDFFMLTGQLNTETTLAVSGSPGDGVLQLSIQYAEPAK